MVAIHERFTEAEFHKDLATRRAQWGDDAELHDLPRTLQQRRFDALVEVFRTANTARDNGITGAAPAPLVNVLVDHDTWADLLVRSGLAPDADLTGDTIDPFTGLAQPRQLVAELMNDPAELLKRTCETSTGTQLRPLDVLRAALAGHIRRVVVNADGVVVDQGRKQRLFTGPAREAALLLLRRCEHPGCDVPATLCQVDHATEWTYGGPTDQEQARGRCGGHNRYKHRHKLESRRATNGRTYTIRADGTIMLPVGVRPPTFPDTDNPDSALPELDPATRGELAQLDPDLTAQLKCTHRLVITARHRVARLTPRR